MKLSEFFEQGNIVRDGLFLKTMYPKATEPSSICYAADRVHLEMALRNPNITALITTKEWVSLVDEARAVVIVQDAQLAYYRLHNFLVENKLMQVHAAHAISASAQIAPTAVIGKHVMIGERVVIEHHAVVGDYTIIGDDSYIGESVVTGSKGLQNLRVDGNSFPIKLAGGVRIGSHCEVLAGAIIQRPYHAIYTGIGDKCQIGPRAVVGHGVTIGCGSMVAGNAEITGNVSIGDGVWIGPSVTVADGISIGHRAKIRIGSVVVEDVGDDEDVSGNFAIIHKRHMRLFTRMKNGQL